MLGKKHRYGGVSLVAVVAGQKCVCVCVCDVSQETEQTALDHSANMSTEIKLVYYFQRGEKIKQNKTKQKNFTKQKKQSYFTLVIIIKFFTTIQSA